jgi:hypothetical protein
VFLTSAPWVIVAVVVFRFPIPAVTSKMAKMIQERPDIAKIILPLAIQGFSVPLSVRALKGAPLRKPARFAQNLNLKRSNTTIQQKNAIRRSRPTIKTPII